MYSVDGVDVCSFTDNGYEGLGKTVAVSSPSQIRQTDGWGVEAVHVRPSQLT